MLHAHVADDVVWPRTYLHVCLTYCVCVCFSAVPAFAEDLEMQQEQGQHQLQQRAQTSPAHTSMHE